MALEKEEIQMSKATAPICPIVRGGEFFGNAGKRFRR